jgi:small subunit ribosomal protein S15
VSRIHSGRKGRSGSDRPYPALPPTWPIPEPSEVTDQAVQLAKGGLSAAQVGTVLRDTYGVPSVRLATGERLVPLLAKRGVTPELPEDLAALLRRVVKLQRHLSEHPTDNSNRRGLALIESRIRRLARYYRDRKLLPETWRYSATEAVLQVE